MKQAPPARRRSEHTCAPRPSPRGRIRHKPGPAPRAPRTWSSVGPRPDYQNRTEYTDASTCNPHPPRAKRQSIQQGQRNEPPPALRSEYVACVRLHARAGSGVRSLRLRAGARSPRRNVLSLSLPVTEEAPFPWQGRAASWDEVDRLCLTSAQIDVAASPCPHFAKHPFGAQRSGDRVAWAPYAQPMRKLSRA